jgi:hypothetical protein
MDPYGQDVVCGAATMRSVPVLVYLATAENSPFGNPFKPILGFTRKSATTRALSSFFVI